MPPINVLKSLYDRAVKHDVDLTQLVNQYVEKHLDELDKKKG